MNTAEIDSPAIFLEWDSRFFGKRIARVQSRCLLPEEVIAVDRWSRENAIDCLYYLADGSNPRSALEAENNGYHLVDVRLTFTRDLISNVPQASYQDIRRGREEDLGQLKKMARVNHLISRFFSDPHFDPQRSAEMYEVWLENDLRSKDAQLWVKTQNDLAVGYSSVRITGDFADFGLLGVEKAYRGKNYGGELFTWTLSRLADAGVRTVDSSTQGKNIGAQVLFQKCGFVSKSIDLWYHKWY